MQATLERLRERREERGDEGGFTLIELLIVIVILGILAAIVVFAVQNLTGQSASAGCQSDYKTVETAAEAYKAQMGAYPSTIATMTKSATQPGSGQTVGPWLRDVPTGSHYNLVINTGDAFSDPAFKSGSSHAGGPGTVVDADLTHDGVIYVVTANNTNPTGTDSGNQFDKNNPGGAPVATFFSQPTADPTGDVGGAPAYGAIDGPPSANTSVANIQPAAPTMTVTTVSTTATYSVNFYPANNAAIACSKVTSA